MSESLEVVQEATSADQGDAKMRTRHHRGKEYPISPAHPLADLFPWASEEEVDVMVAEIGNPEIGQKTPINRLPDGRIIDGRTRELACIIAGVEPTYTDKDLDEDGVRALVNAGNMTRRHMTESQRAIVAAGLATWGPGRPPKKATQDAISKGEAAVGWKISKKSIERAKAVLKTGTPKLVERVRDGQLDVATAAKLARLTEAEQEDVAKSDNPKSAATAKLKSVARATATEPVAPTPIVDPVPVEHVSGPAPDDNPAVESHPPQAQTSEDISPTPSAEQAPTEHPTGPAPEESPVETSSPSQDEATEERSEVSDESSRRPAITPEQVQVAKLAAHISEFGALIDTSLDSSGLLRTAMKRVITRKADEAAKRLSKDKTVSATKMAAFLRAKIKEDAVYKHGAGPSNAVAQHHLEWQMLAFIEGVFQELPAEIAKLDPMASGESGAA